MAFKKLLEELGVMAKSQPAAGDDDANIQAAGNTGGDSNNDQGATDAAADSAAQAAAAAGSEGTAGSEGGAAAGGAEGDGDGDDKPMAKSFEVDLGGGQTAQVIDAEELVKSLVDRIEATESETGEVLGACVALIKSQGAQIEKLTATVSKLAGSGTGRKAVLSVVDKNALTKSAPASAADKGGLSPQEFLSKAEVAFNGKAINGHELSLAEAAINRGEKVPASIIQRVMGFGAQA